MAKTGLGPPRKELWAYAYYITMPENEVHLRKIQDLLDHEHVEATKDARIWAGRVVVEPLVTRILVVSDSPAQDRGVNRRLAAAFLILKAVFDMTIPLAVLDDAAFLPMNGRPLTEPS